MQVIDLTVKVSFEDLARYVNDITEINPDPRFNWIDEVEVDSEEQMVYIQVRRVEDPINENPWKGIIPDEV